MPRRKQKKSLSMMALPRKAILFFSAMMLFAMVLPVQAREGARAQEFVVTAYYSPKPNQCCYFRGNYEAEIAFNGGGVRSADGTRVYAGMLAAPPNYPFGTVIELPGLGVGTVHDRGGRIIEWSKGVHRIDVWMGEGEEGLARALAWGTRSVKGVVYPEGIKSTSERITLSNISADRSALAALPKSDEFLTLASLEVGQKSSSVRLLQKKLFDTGYLRDIPTGFYGPATEGAVAKLKKEFSLTGDGKNTGENFVAFLSAAVLHNPKTSNVDATPFLGLGSKGDSVKDAQRILSHLGYYRGRIDGVYSSRLHAAVLAFQRSEGIVKHSDEKGAGRIGPATRSAIAAATMRKRSKQEAKSILMAVDIKRDILQSKRVPGRTLVRGDRGSDVTNLQRTLSDLGYFPSSKVNGNFGLKTEEAVLKFQLAEKLIAKAGVKGAGVVGPATRQALFSSLLQKELVTLRTSGKKS